MNIENKNELICKFMGYQCIGKNHYIVNVGIGTEVRNELLPTQHMKFNKSYDWIMPVVENIESLVFENDVFYNFNILGGCQVYIISSDGNELVDSDKGQSKLECIYNAVVEFIEWYNSEGNEKHI